MKRARLDKAADSSALSATPSSPVVVSSTIHTILGPQAKIYQLEDFIRLYAPSLDCTHWPDANLGREKYDDNLERRLQDTLVSPSNALQPMPNIKKAIRQESLSTLVDDVIWSLVNQHKQKNQNNRDQRIPNVLSNGYVVASELLGQEVTSCPQMQAGVMCKRLSGNASFCKTSRYFQTLHERVGDDLIRILLLRTSLFVPIINDDNDVDQQLNNSHRGPRNYMMICGPFPKRRSGLLPARKPDTTCSKTNEAPPCKVPRKNRKRRRRQKSANHDKETQEDPQQQERYAYLSPCTTINRRSLFYSNDYIPKVGLSKNHILNEAQPGKGKLLLENIFPSLKNKNGRKRRKIWTRLRDIGPSLCDEILVRHSRCDYHRLLDYHCPLPGQLIAKQQRGGTMNGEASNNPTLPQVSAAHTDSDTVVAFLTSVLRQVFPQSFWGSQKNFNQIVAVVDIFVKLRRHEDLPNKTIMKGIRVTDFFWLLGKKESNSRGRPKLCRAGHEAATSFYVTESEFSGKRVLYYRKPVWSMLRSLSMKHLLNKQYVEISLTETQTRLQNQQMGCSRLHLLPKSTGVRPIATLCKRERSIFHETINESDREETKTMEELAGQSTAKKRRLAEAIDTSLNSLNNSKGKWSNRFKSTNELLRDTYEALKYEQRKQPSLLGAGLDGLYKFYPHFHQFVSKVKSCQGNTILSGRDISTQLYFASVDVRHCYDNIDQDRLLNIIADILSEEDYMIRRYSVLRSCKSMDQVIMKKQADVGPPETYDAFHKHQLAKKNDNQGTVLVDDASSSLTNKEKCMFLLREHLKSHIVVAKGRYGNRYLLQTKGIPQGSVLSSLLCNIYYGDVEQNILDAELVGKGSHSEVGSANKHIHLLVRITDDFLLITTDEGMHKTFLQTMYRGKPSLGVHINKDKISSNVEVSSVSDNGTSILVPGSSSGFETLFPWCGMLFDTKTCEVKVDYSRFAGTKAADRLTVSRNKQQGGQLKKQMKAFVRPRCLPIFFDSFINSRGTTLASFFDMMVLCAIKMNEYIASCDMMDTPLSNPHFLLACIEDVTVFSWQLIKDSVEQAYSSLKCQVKTKFLLSKRLALSLSWRAFQVTLDKSKVFESLAPYLEEKIQCLQDCPSVPQLLLGGSQLDLLLGVR